MGTGVSQTRTLQNLRHSKRFEAGLDVTTKITNYLKAEANVIWTRTSRKGNALSSLGRDLKFGISADLSPVAFAGWKVLKKDVPIALMDHALNQKQMRDALRVGAAGFLPYSMASDALLGALRLMASGEIFIPVTDTDNVQFTKSSPREKFLSSREREVLDGLLSGHSNRQIADRIGLSEVTIKYHLKSLRSKLGARNRTHAALRAIELGIG